MSKIKEKDMETIRLKMRLRRFELLPLFFFLLPSLLFPAEKEPLAYRLDLGNLDYDHQLLLFSLQGIVNQKGPRLFLNTQEIFWQWRPSDERWMEYYSSQKGFHFRQLSSLEALLRIFRNDIKGLVLYDPEIDATRYIACTYASLEDLLPVSPKMIEEEPFLRAFPLRRDLSKGKRSDREWYEWAIRDLMPFCNRKMAYSAGHSHDDVNLGGDPGIVIGLDFAISKKMFVFNLSPSAKPSSIYGTPIPGYPEDAKLFDEIMDKLEKPAGIWGWAEPEGDFAIRVSTHNNYVMCCGAPNLSFHAKAPVTKGYPFKQQGKYTIENTKLEDRYYLAFVTNEGDTPKIVAGWQAGGWLNPHRGEVAINWGINPILVAEFPAMMEAYYSTATPNDYFFAGVSGAGYVFIDKLPDLHSFARHTAHYLRIADKSVIDAWSTSESLPLYSKYAEIAGLEGMLRNPRGEGKVTYLENGTPLLEPDSSLFYISGDTSPKEIADKIKKVAEKHNPPFFIEVYGGVSENCPAYYKAIMDELGEDYKAVRLDEMMCAAKLAGQMEIEPQRIYLKPLEEGKAKIRLRNYSPEVWEGELEFELPPSYEVSPLNREFALKKGEMKELEISLKARGTLADGGVIKVKEREKNIQRILEIKPLKQDEIGFEEMFDDLGVWTEWPGGGAELHPLIAGGAEIKCPENLPYAAVERDISVDLDEYPILMLDVRNCEGLWALKLRPVDDMRDICLIADTSRTGVFQCDVVKATGWKGKRSFKVIIFAIGEGREVDIGWLRMLSEFVD